MFFIILGKPLVFWLGLIALIDFSLQLYLGYKLVHGHPDYFSAHKTNAMILTGIIFVHLILGLLLYF
ncbi:MAG: hypothetical protein NTZ13_03590 [Candidatus Parcubacteria bacterium]|nr:hypothetical protein [Candidatus Parcubacteria bacterium]